MFGKELRRRHGYRTELKLKKVMYYVVFNSGTSLHDRIENITYKIDQPDFFKWMDNKRKELEKEIGKSVVVINCSKIT